LTETPANLARSTLLNLSGFAVPVVVQLVTVPLYIKYIGVDRYGVMALVWLLLGYFGFFDIGFGQAISSKIAGLSRATPQEREHVFWTGTCLSFLTGAAGGLLLYVVAAKLFTNVFAVPPQYLAETAAALPFVAMSLPVITAISALSGTLQGREAFGVMNLSQMTGAVLYQIFPLLVAMFFTRSLPDLVIAAIAGRLVTAVLLLIFCLRRVPARPIPRMTLSLILPMLRYGGWVTLTGMISPLLTVFDRFIIGAIAGMGAVTAYTIPYNLAMRISTLPSAFQNALFPRFAKIDEQDAFLLRARAVRIVVCLMTPILITALIIIKPFLIIWIGKSLAVRAAPVGQIIILGLWANTLAFVPFGFLQSRGRPDVPAKFHVIELFGYAPVLYVLTRSFGVAGAAWAWDARVLADLVLLLAAVRMLPVLRESFLGLGLVAGAFAWAWFAIPSAAIYWGFGAVLLMAGALWAWRNLPPDIPGNLLARINPRRPAMEAG
jgi:O-antigen/teichoic acid export membrane protein